MDQSNFGYETVHNEFICRSRLEANWASLYRLNKPGHWNKPIYIKDRILLSLLRDDPKDRYKYHEKRNQELINLEAA